jgi:Thioredoxin.
MNKLLFLILIPAFCFVMAQDKKVVTDAKSGKSMLIGTVSVSDFRDTAFSGWWNEEYNEYQPKTKLLKIISKKTKSCKITIVMGTWCSDSKREVPRFFKILDLLKYPADSVNIICVDRKKNGADNKIVNLKIELIPTFIFYRDNIEAGRIVESPKETLEKDILRILR